MWRGGVRSTMSVAAPFVWRCLSGSAITPFPQRLDLLADQLVRHAVVMLGELDVVIEVDATALPRGVLVGKGWQRHERRLVQRFEERPPAHAPTAHRAVVDLVEQGPDRRVEFGQ